MKRTIFQTEFMGQTARIRYDDVAGYYATIDGRILDDGSGINGYSDQAYKRLNEYLAGEQTFEFGYEAYQL